MRTLALTLLLVSMQDGGEAGPTGRPQSSLGLMVPAPVGTQLTTPCHESARYYLARVERVIDGDTYDMQMSLGFGVSIRVAIRLQGLDTPEMNTPEGRAAKAAAQKLLESGLITVAPTGQQTFARWVAAVYVGGLPLADLLRSAGHVKKGAER